MTGPAATLAPWADLPTRSRAAIIACHAVMFIAPAIGVTVLIYCQATGHPL